jgi:aminopeptidase N
MSSYLVAFVIGEFDYIEKKCPNGMPVRVYTPVGKQDMGIFSLDVKINQQDFIVLIRKKIYYYY